MEGLSNAYQDALLRQERAPEPIEKAAIVEFKAGKMTCVGKRVTSDPRKGKIVVSEDPSGFVRFQWFERSSNVAEDELCVFPEEAEWRRVLSAPASSRVYMLRFRSMEQKHFFWMQEANAMRDREVMGLINGALGIPSDESLQMAHHAVERQDEMLSSFQSARAEQSSQAESSSQQRLDMSYLQSALQRIGGSASPETPAGQARPRVETPQAPVAARKVEQGGETATTRTTEDSARFVQKKARLIQQVIIEGAKLHPELEQDLMEYLPGDHLAMDHLDSLLTSTQFKQALVSFTAALESGQLGELLRAFGLPPDTTGVDGLLKVLQESEPKDNKSKDMDVDEK